MSSSDDSKHIISILLSRGAVLLNLQCADRDAALIELVRQVPETLNQPESQTRLLNAIRERENLHSTGIGDGVALPHARNALGNLVREPVIVFARHPGGVPFGAIDGKPVHLLFLLVTTTVPQHLLVLARISRLLRGPVLRRTLLGASNREEVLTALRDAELA
jgi:mannitol/fructose-specific phosphotransferase system IIA component (Ntr-type)